MKKKSINSLLWRLAAVFVLVLVLSTTLSFIIYTRYSTDHTNELNQKLNRGLAPHTVQEVSKYIQNGQLNEEGLTDIMHSMMVINPSVEVYILDNSGNILSYVAPHKVVKLERVSLGPIESYLADPEAKSIFEGDDPRNPGERKIFSAAPILEEGRQTGYVYIVLAGQKLTSLTEKLESSHITGLLFKMMLMILACSLVIGLLGFWFITKRLDKVVAVMQRFRAGDHKARIEESGGKELKVIAEQFNEMADTIESNIEELKSVDRLRKELISNVSHDLRTPIASIQGYAETLEIKAGRLTEEELKEYAETIVDNSKRLKTLVDGLFELSKLESGHITVHKEPFSIAELMHDIASKYRLISQKKGVSINTILEKGSPMVMGDLSMIDRVLQNLIDNAIKFCKDGDTINLELDLEKPSEVRVLISDSGAGIAQEHLEHIFERYFTRNSDLNPQGTGLGLSISKKIIELHGGEIEVESQLNTGTTFRFSLPRAVA